MANKFTDAVHKLILPGKGRDRVTTKAVLTAMAWHTDNKSGVFWGSHALFAHEANCSRDGVRESIPKLIELGLLTIIGKKPTRFGPCHMFKMNYDVIVKYSDQVAEAPSGSPAGLEGDQAGEEPGGSATHYQVAEPHHQGVEPSHQVARPLKNSSLNSSLNSSFNSSSHDKPYASLRPLRGDHSMEAPSVRPGEPGPVDPTDLAKLVQDVESPSPVNPKTRVEVPARSPWDDEATEAAKWEDMVEAHAKAVEVEIPHDRRFPECKCGWAARAGRKCIYCKSEKKTTPKEMPEVTFDNPVRTHDWTKNKDVCCVCQASRDEARYGGITCETAEEAGA